MPALKKTLHKPGQHTGEFLCSLCDACFLDNSILKVHLFQRHSITSFYACKLCETIFLNHLKLDRHLRQDHDLPVTATCDICENIFQNKADLDRHIDSRHASSHDLTYCTTCSKAFTSSEVLEYHYQLEHNLHQHHPFTLQTGDMSASSQESLGYVCDLCGNAFLTEDNLKVHITARGAG